MESRDEPPTEKAKKVVKKPKSKWLIFLKTRTFWAYFLVLFFLLVTAEFILNIKFHWWHLLGFAGVSFFFSPPILLPLFQKFLKLPSKDAYWKKLKKETETEKDLDFSDRFLGLMRSVLLILSLILTGLAAFLSPSFNDFLYNKEIVIRGTVTLNGDSIPNIDGGHVFVKFYDEKENLSDDTFKNLNQSLTVNNGLFSLNVKVPKNVQGAHLDYKKEGYESVDGDSVFEDIYYSNIYKEFRVNRIESEPEISIGKEVLEIVMISDSTLKMNNGIFYTMRTGDKITVFDNKEVTIDPK